MIHGTGESQYGLDMQVLPSPMAAPDWAVDNLGVPSSQLIFCEA